MKIKMIFLITFLLIFGISTSSTAAISDPPVCFYLLDDTDAGDDGQVALSILQPFSLPSGYYLAYNIGSGWDSWSNAPSYFSVPTKKLIYFKITDGFIEDDDGILTFTGYDGVYHTVDGYSSVLINWDGLYQIHFATADASDHVGPVPIPATVWIFGAGLMGLVGIRRKLKS